MEYALAKIQEGALEDTFYVYDLGNVNRWGGGGTLEDTFYGMT